MQVVPHSIDLEGGVPAIYEFYIDRPLEQVFDNIIKYQKNLSSQV